MLARRLEAVEPDGERDLGPVPDLVQQDVEQQLARRYLPLLVANGEHPDLIGRLVVEVADVLLELAPDRGTVVEERRCVVAR